MRRASEKNRAACRLKGHASEACPSPEKRAQIPSGSFEFFMQNSGNRSNLATLIATTKGREEERALSRLRLRKMRLIFFTKSFDSSGRLGVSSQRHANAFSTTVQRRAVSGGWQDAVWPKLDPLWSEGLVLYSLWPTGLRCWGLGAVGINRSFPEHGHG